MELLGGARVAEPPALAWGRLGVPAAAGGKHPGQVGRHRGVTWRLGLAKAGTQPCAAASAGTKSLHHSTGQRGSGSWDPSAPLGDLSSEQISPLEIPLASWALPR